MVKRETPFLLCESICEAVRHRLPQALASDSTFFFDYEGYTPISTVDPSTVHAIVDRLLRYALRTLREGVFFRVTVHDLGSEQCRVNLRVATVARATDPATSAPLPAVPSEEAVDDADMAVVRVLCKGMGGGLKVLTDAGGYLAEASFLVPILEPALSLPDVQADGASVWLVSSPTFVMKMLARRLQRLGWHVRIFESLAEVELGLQMEGEAPALLIGSAHRGIGMAHMARLRGQLPPDSRVVVQMLQHMSLDEEPAPGIEVHAIPLSPRRLMHYTATARRLGQRASGTTQAGALEAPVTGTVLVVDDNHVNRILCEEMVRMLGYRVSSAESGEEAIERCLAERPMLVLMDLHLPGLGGMAAARQLKALQASGQLAAFPIWVVSAALPAEPLAAAHPFDGAIPKPIGIPALRAALKTAAGQGEP